MNLTLSSRIATLLFLLLCGWGLGWFYAVIGRVLPPGWLSIAVLHSVLALALWRLAGRLKRSPRRSRIAYVPAAVALGSCILGALATRAFWAGAPPREFSWDPRILAFVLWIPVIEEWVFRMGIGGVLRMRLGPFWGAYGSALVFAMAHGITSAGYPMIPIGPFLLALACEWIYAISGRLSPGIALHAACNASGFIFAALDPRWVEWLQAFYLKV